jgi:hypothetical protein
VLAALLLSASVPVWAVERTPVWSGATARDHERSSTISAREGDGVRTLNRPRSRGSRLLSNEPAAATLPTVAHLACLWLGHVKELCSLSGELIIDGSGLSGAVAGLIVPMVGVPVPDAGYGCGSVAVVRTVGGL